MISANLKWGAAGVLVLIVAAVVISQAFHVANLERARDNAQAAADARLLVVQRLETAASAAQAERKKEQDHAQASILAADQAASAATSRAAAALAAAGVADRLRDAAARAAAACRGGVPPRPASAGGDAAPADPGLVLADVLGRMERRGRDLAELADARGAALNACNTERAALTTP